MSPTPSTPSSATTASTAAVPTSAGSSPAPEIGKYGGFAAAAAAAAASANSTSHGPFSSFGGPFSGYGYAFSDPAMNNPYYTPAASTAAIQQQSWPYHMGTTASDPLGMHRFTNPVSLSGGPSRRKRRVLFNQSQVNHLLMSYKKKKYLTPGEREKLAQETGLSSNQVKIWFQNHRYKCKREGKELGEGDGLCSSNSDDESGNKSRSSSPLATELCADVTPNHVKIEGHNSPMIPGFGVYGGEKDQCLESAYNSFPPGMNMPMNMSSMYPTTGASFASFPYPYPQNSYSNPYLWPSGNQ
ncbi:hypothetical protein L596_022456 [Steinernema carpocapsae]|uniref:Homeobox domain-containing protein n=1 Tax=Steinernema carpocapsae TaxID=34508 RepID=A0A4V6A082_STECR|nr:hypothetical protein L596_022456 [Steinernema carpocapsae]